MSTIDTTTPGSSQTGDPSEGARTHPDIQDNKTVSAQDREYMKRLGAFEEEGHRARREAHLALSVKERLVRSLTLAARSMRWVNPERLDDDPAPWYDRARELGLYLP